MMLAAALRRLALIVAATAALAACDRAEEQPAAPAAPAESASRVGTIRGQLSYPSDYLPEDLQVCARAVRSGEVYCNSRRDGQSYSLEVPAGAYHVWAQTGDWPQIRAFFSEFVRCGLTAACVDHTPIEVVVGAGGETSGVDPGDWYSGA